MYLYLMYILTVVHSMFERNVVYIYRGKSMVSRCVAPIYDPKQRSDTTYAIVGSNTQYLVSLTYCVTSAWGNHVDVYD